MTSQSSLQIIRDEHAALAAMLRSMDMMVQRGPGNEPERFFDVLRAMLFYVDEFPERLHHPKESDLLFPRVARLAPETMETVVRLEKDHAQGEAAVRELQHLLLAWELVGESRRTALHGFLPESHATGRNRHPASGPACAERTGLEGAGCRVCQQLRPPHGQVPA